MNKTVSAKGVTSSGVFESEIALIIRHNADNIRNELAASRRLLDCYLEPKPPQIIRDTYFDTKEGSLREKRITLRIRRINDTLILSTKTDVRRTAANIIQRREIERPWSEESITLLGKNLQLKTPTISVSKFHSTPVSEVLATMGLHVIQERETTREPRDVVDRRKTAGSILAELAIDHVTYSLDEVKVGLSEIEVEAKALRSLSKVREIADALISKYRPSLQQWFHGKFVTGLAIQRLLKTGDLQNRLVNGDLDPEAIAVIENSIRARTF